MSSQRYDEWFQSIERAIDERPAWGALLRSVVDHPLLMMIERRIETIDKSFKSRLRRFCAYQQQIGEDWFEPQLNAYRDYLLETEQKPMDTVMSYTSTIRCGYRQLAGDECFREFLYSFLPDSYQDVEKWRHIEDFCKRLKYEVDVFVTRTPPTPRDYLRDLLRDCLFLTPSEINQLLAAPAMNTLQGVRDRAVIATLICTGVRAHELVNLNVEDVLSDALQIRDGHKIGRIIPYENLKWGLELLQTWIRKAGIAFGPIFVSIKGGDQLNIDEADNPKRLSSAMVGRVLRSYPIRVDDQHITVKPRHLRYMYGYILLSQGTPDDIIRRNLGFGRNEGMQYLLRSLMLPEQVLLRRTR